MTQDWYKDAIFYEVFVRAYADSNGDGIGDLPGLTSKLDYLKWLGVDAVWMLPICTSPLRDDGYDVQDYTQINPDYGTLDDFRKLVTEAHKRDLRVIVELIPSHTSDQNYWFQASRDPNHPEHAKYRDWYVWSDTDQKYKDARIIFVDYEPSNWTFDEKRGAYFWHRFFNHQPDLNYDCPEVQRAMLRVVQFWVDFGVDGFRVDATPYLYERDGTTCENLPETHAYLKRIRKFLDAYAPGTMLLSEANQWPEDVLPYFGDGDEFHMNFHFPLMPRIFMSLAKADRQPIEQILARTPALPEGCQWGAFLRCHDELTLEMVTPEERTFMWNFYAPEPRMRLNMGIRRRLMPLLDNNRARLEVANSILLTFIGSPVFYYGDEIGMGDNIRLEDRDGVRTPMQWDDSSNAGFSTASAEKLSDPVIDDEVYGYRRVNVAAQREDFTSLLHRLRELLRIRKEHPVFGRGAMQLLAATPNAVLAYLRTPVEGVSETMLMLNNLSQEAKTASLNLADYAGQVPLDVLTNETLPEITSAPYTVTLDGYGYRWLKLG